MCESRLADNSYDKVGPCKCLGAGQEEEGGLSFDFKLLGADVRPKEVRTDVV